MPSASHSRASLREVEPRCAARAIRAMLDCMWRRRFGGQAREKAQRRLPSGERRMCGGQKHLAKMKRRKKKSLESIKRYTNIRMSTSTLSMRREKSYLSKVLRPCMSGLAQNSISISLKVKAALWGKKLFQKI